ncbi:cytochrome o ubiquinol oxidase subunit IV [Buchnera aphidicola (Nipponaphis monzeni)]|uniref:Cytochrome bo(3) ubiquinol oxidase subunit 4 n=1 Tax=Buchnera aphidicola (Nipponaphis monzeni) TaxID=2495405 RepID=A0A455TAG4_9GAMM|nr:cytochrome C oxidase subunit IV family protein [Buchnera aphidicola]BBI01357.1 cytochrome o ubiquinol oxidase subunit IV [Buchnera aphidicola (Nipponaphis monzeni)]
MNTRIKNFFYKNIYLNNNLLGLLISIILTYLSLYIIIEQIFLKDIRLLFITLVSIIQIIVHIKYFLHISNFSDYNWSVSIFVFSAIVVLIIILGSMWIMNDLNHHLVIM